MEKQKRWQFYLILAVVVLTLINILPTIFYYTKPLKHPIDEKRAENVAQGIIERVNQLEGDSKEWIYSFCNLLGTHPKSVELKKEDPGIFVVTFGNAKDAELFKRFLPKAGMLIPFIPSQLELYPGESAEPEQVLIARQINAHLDPSQTNQQFSFFSKMENGKISPKYREFIYDRASEVILGLTGQSQQGAELLMISKNPNKETVLTLAREIKDVTTAFGEISPITKRYFSSFSRVSGASAEELIQKFQSGIDKVKADLEKEKNTATSDQRISLIDSEIKTLDQVSAIVKRNTSDFKVGGKPLTEKEIQTALKNAEKSEKDNIQTVSLMGRNPYIESLEINWGNDTITVKFYNDVEKVRAGEGKREIDVISRDKMNNFIINELARVSRESNETFAPEGTQFAIALNHLTNAQSFLNFNLPFLAEKLSGQVKELILSSWLPNHQDLSGNNYPVIDYNTYKTLGAQEKKLGLVVYAPVTAKSDTPEGFRNTSLYVIAKGMNTLVQKYQANPDSPENQKLKNEIGRLVQIMQQRGFIVYPGSSLGIAPEFSNDFIFELNDYYANLLAATREDFYVKGSKRNATLDFTDVEQRITALNNIDDKIQEDLVKSRDEYSSAQVDMSVTRRYEVPAPIRNVYLANMKLSFVKYFRGDDRKILRWGLDLSGGKTVRVGLKDQNNKVVTNPDDLKQAVNELYTRINKMGVSERTIRIENNNIILDFPGSQSLSASELIKSSAMYFHIVNEKYSLRNNELRETVNQFLQNVWNEAVVTNRKDAQSINLIAWQHLGGDEGATPRSEAAKALFDHGLRLAGPDQVSRSTSFNDTLSAIGVMRGQEFTEWNGQTHPLMVIFHNYALEGASLTNIYVGFDVSQGNSLSFSVKSSHGNTRKGNPQEEFFAWTSQFAEDRIAGTPKEAYSQGTGWRMAVVLNDTIITSPALRSALREGGTISGHFTQREINQLAADLKAGSLSFTPQILSEQNVSAELGTEERARGIAASIMGMVLVATVMIGYYRFAGVVATCAVLFNLLIMWGVLQNLGAALTLPGIAGIVLTIGMAVDANVLVYERIREEFKISGRIASAIQAGYRKAFSAIFDSNITTIIAALILIQFDSGPIKGFATTLIIGLVSSMFSALFLTRYFFAGWVQDPKHKELKMASLIGETNYDFLGKAKIAFSITLAFIVIGSFFFIKERNTMLGMDFTGGYSLTVELKDKGNDFHYRTVAADALLAHGATANDFEIRQLSKPNQLRIQLGLGMEEAGHPFYNMAKLSEEGQYAYKYQQNPRINWLVSSLAEGGLQIKDSELSSLDTDWSVMSGQFSETMRHNAIWALSLALLCILIYISIRFEFKYAVGGVLALVHDVVITVGLYSMLGWMGVPVQIDLTVVAAIMTILGYSLNNTIVIFDRIREDMKLYRKLSFQDIINHSINITLSRTILTSSTTLVAILPFVIFGGTSIFDFSLIMAIGIVVGIFSSLFIAGPIMYYFHKREENGTAHAHV